MPTVAQRFANSPTLGRCVDEGYRMVPGEPDRDAVWRLQTALHDLGYEIEGGIDGVFGTRTADTIVAFKADEGLVPGDGVASRGTISRLDEYFSAETPFPDSPDPATDRLPDVVAAANRLAVEWLTAGVAAIDAHLAGTPDARFDEVAERNFRLASLSTDRTETLRVIVRAEMDAARRNIAAGVVDVVPHTREQWRTTFPESDYRAVDFRVGERLFVSPAFRNALDVDERAYTLIRLLLSLDGRLQGRFPPVCRRYESLTGDEGVRNKPSYAAFAFETATSAFATFGPVPAWPEVHF